jgi:hypothetical protein
MILMAVLGLVQKQSTSVGTGPKTINKFRAVFKPPPPPLRPDYFHLYKTGTKEYRYDLIPVLQIRDIYPRSLIRIFSIPDPTKKNRGGHKFQKIENYLIFEQVQKKNRVKRHRI